MLKFLVVLTVILNGIHASSLNDAVDGRIVGGEAAEEGQFPYTVSLQANNNHFCGGSIISPNWILIAAYCFKCVTSESIRILVGTISLNSSGVVHDVAEIISHTFNDINFTNDVALVRLSKPIQYNNLVQPVKLANSATPDGTSCTVSGWGLTSFPPNDTSMPNNLQYASLTAISLEKCQKEYDFVTSAHVCTKAPSGKEICSYDAGGPLVCNGVQHGIVSFGVQCAKGIPDGYTRVAYYNNWIKTKTGL